MGKEGFEPSSTSVTNLNEDAQEVIKDNLDVMKDIVMQIREDPEFAKTIYADCPRLQHMLEQRPDLRPIFEDPNLVRINFEEVYKAEGGVLPEDEEKSKKKSILAAIVNSPCFKVLKVFLLIKKLLGCIFGGGFAFVKGILTGCCCDNADALADVDADADADGADADPKTNANKEALNKAADHMEDPEVQEQMNDLLENDPEGLQDAIENDPELRELRDSNPLCAEIMSDPETMKILTDPDNLRALGDAPDLIDADFADPDWQPPEGDIECGADGNVSAGHTVNMMPDGVDGGDVDMDIDDNDVDVDADDNDVDNQEGEEGEEEEEGVADDYELGDNDNNNDNNAKANKGGNKQQNKKNQNKNGENNNGGGGFLSQVGAGITDMIAAEIVGVGFSEMTGNDDPLAGLEEAGNAADAADAADDAADQAADEANNAADKANEAADNLAMAAAASDAVDTDMVDGLEDGMDEVEDTYDEKQDAAQGKNAAAVGAGAAVGVAAGGAAAVAISRGGGDEEEGSVASEDGEKEIEEDEKKKKKGKFGFVGKWASAVSTAGKEYIAGAILGDDLGEMLVERQEEESESEGEDDKRTKSDEENQEDKKKEEGKGEKKKKGLFRRKR